MVLTRHGDRTPAFWANPANSIGSLSVSAAEAGFWVVDGPAANRSLIPSKEVVIRSLCLVCSTASYRSFTACHRIYMSREIQRERTPAHLKMTWTVIQHYGPDHLGVCLNGPNHHQRT